MCCCAAALPQNTATKLTISADKRVSLAMFDMEFSSSRGQNPFPKQVSASSDRRQIVEIVCPSRELVNAKIRN
jgi:hypothetical protein